MEQLRCLGGTVAMHEWDRNPWFPSWGARFLHPYYYPLQG